MLRELIHRIDGRLQEAVQQGIIVDSDRLRALSYLAQREPPLLAHIESITPASITVRTFVSKDETRYLDGDEWTFEVNDETVVRRTLTNIDYGELFIGEIVQIEASRDPGQKAAVLIVSHGISAP